MALNRLATPHGTPREPAGPAAWHRQYGILVMAGEGIRRDERIYGASLIDIAPTVLTLFDLPIGQDMDGRLAGSLRRDSGGENYSELESVEGESGMHTARSSSTRLKRANSCSNSRSGYIEDPGADKEKAAESAKIESSTMSPARSSGEVSRMARPLRKKSSGAARGRSLSPPARELLLQAGYLAQTERLICAVSDDEKPDTASGKLLWRE